jgi:hypothetical protein
MPWVLFSGLSPSVVLLVIAAQTVGFWALASVLFYGGGLLTVLTVSALYNLWPVSPAKWILRRLDHSAIYLLIAGTYTPVVTQMKASVESVALLIGVWVMSGVGIALKLCILERTSGGWSGSLQARAEQCTALESEGTSFSRTSKEQEEQERLKQERRDYWHMMLEGAKDEHERTRFLIDSRLENLYDWLNDFDQRMTRESHTGLADLPDCACGGSGP